MVAVMQSFNYAHPLHTVHIVQGVSNAHCSKRSEVEPFHCINFGRATDRCVGTDAVLEEVIHELTPALELAGYQVVYEKILVETAEDAIRHRFLSSPTIRVNGIDICDSVQESDCGCCGEISGTQVDCRVFEYHGQLYEVPPKAMLAEGILKKAFTAAESCCCDCYELPENLQNFFSGKEEKQSCCCCSTCC